MQPRSMPPVSLRGVALPLQVQICFHLARRMLNVRLEVLLFANDVVGLLKFHKPIYTQTLPMPFMIPTFFLELPSRLVVPMAHCGHL